MDSLQAKGGWLLAVPLIILAIGMLLNVYLTLRLAGQLETAALNGRPRPSLPCAAIPTRFVMEEPVCAQKLIEAMNVTNFRVVANASELRAFHPEVEDWVRKAAALSRGAGNRSR